MMNQQERGQVAVIIDQMAQYYGRKYEKSVISMMIDDLEDMPLESVIRAFKAYRLDPKNRVMPLPAQIRDMIKPTVSHEAEAREILARIKAAIKTHGGYQGAGAQDAIGPVGWQYVNELGGWFHLCFSTDFITNSNLQAQCRDRLCDLMKHGETLKQVDRPALEYRPKAEVLQIERDTQVARMEQWQIEDIEKRKKPDPNEDYAAKTPEEREALIQSFLAGLKVKEMP